MAKRINRTKKKGAITRSEVNIERLNAKEVLTVAKRITKNRPVVHLVKNTRTMEYEKHMQL